MDTLEYKDYSFTLSKMKWTKLCSLCAIIIPYCIALCSTATCVQGDVSSPFLCPDLIPLLRQVMSFSSDCDLLRETDRWGRK